MEYEILYNETPQSCQVRQYSTAIGMVRGEKKSPFRHMHNNYEITLFESNSLCVINGGTEIRLRTPCLVLHRPYTLHGIYMLESVRCLRTVINFSGEYLEGMDRTLVNAESVFARDLGAAELDETQYRRLKGMYEAFLQRENQHLRPFLLAMILREAERIVPVQQKALARRDEFYISRLIRYVAQNYTDDMSSAALAHRFGISVTKLNRDFRTYTSTTVHEFVNRVRMEAAVRMLMQDIPVAVAANRCGYACSSHFIRAFRSLYGITPLQYARRMRTDTAEV